MTLPAGFLDLPPLVYRDDPRWIPEEPEGVERAFSEANPWFGAGREAEAFCVPGAARAAAFFDPAATVGGRPIAFFGYYETLGDPAAVRDVLSRCEAFGRAHGARALYGPINFSTFGQYRLRVLAEPDAMTFPGEPYNPPRYAQELEAAGFQIEKGYVTQVGRPPMDVIEMLRPVREMLLAEGYRIETLDPDLWMAKLRELHELIDVAFGENFAYTPLMWEAFAQACGRSFVAKACPDVSVLCTGPEGDIAGFVLMYPNWGPLCIREAGVDRVSPQKLDYATHMPLLRAKGRLEIVYKTIGVRPKHRKKGIMGALTVEVVERARGEYARWLAALIREDNPSRKYGQYGTEFERRYALYGKEL